MQGLNQNPFFMHFLFISATTLILTAFQFSYYKQHTSGLVLEIVE